MEQHIGHRSYYQNLRDVIDQNPELDASWVPVTYQHRPTIGGKSSPWLPTVKGSLAGRLQVRQGAQQATERDVAFFNTQVPAVLGGKVAQQQPYILSTDITPLQYDEMAEHYEHHPDSDNLWSFYKYRTNVKVFQKAARIVPWSSWAAESLVQDYGVDPNRIEVIAPGVNTNVWRPDTSKETTKPCKILFVGGDFERKGGNLLLKAFRSLPKGLAELMLVTRSHVPSSDNIKVYRNMQPNSAELIQLYQSCDLFVLPTQAEAFGIAAIEACAVGLPVVATRVGGLTDIVVDGETGFLIEAGDIEALAQRLQLLAENDALRQSFGSAARQRAERYFDNGRNAKRIATIIKEVVGERS
ncbi:MAG: glycosyltransferase family 4 protein [Chloroflexota bacterium]